MRLRLLTATASLIPALTILVAAAPTQAAVPSATPKPAATSASLPASTPAPTAAVTVRRACDTKPARAGRVECMALLRTNADGTPLTFNPRGSANPADSANPAALGPTQLQSAYELAAAAATRGGDRTVAIVDAYDDPNAEADLATYRSQYGLPPCTSDTGCFRKVNQDGTSTALPQPDSGWAIEVSLDLDMVSAICPSCHILLVEANDSQDINMVASVATAAKLGATEISNSYGEPEYRGETSLEPFFNQPGVTITAAAGDAGYGVSYPAASAHVTAVGGTTLWPSAGRRGWAEQAWGAGNFGGTGSGCSTQIAKPTWQHDACTHRTDNDVAAVADPQTPVAVYDSFEQPLPWVGVGGTSVSSPIVASVYALIGDAPSAGSGAYFYSHRNDLFDVTSGVNGTCAPAYLCTAGAGYDGPTGLGTPDFTGLIDTGGSCVDGWSRTTQPIPSEQQVASASAPETLDQGIAANSSSDVWTVGMSEMEDPSSAPVGSADGYMTNIEHWNGSTWSQVPSPNPLVPGGTRSSVLKAVSFDSRKDGWAVGSTSSGGLMVTQWNGSQWSLSPVVDPSASVEQGGVTYGSTAVALAITADSPRDVWLAGLTLNGPFMEHWNGTEWSLVSVPNDGTLPLYILGLHAVSSTDAWAVGYHVDGTRPVDPVILHWDGHVWSPSGPTIGTREATLVAISGSSADDLWAVGTTVDDTESHAVALTEHWDGHAWTIVTTPTLDTSYLGLTDVTSTSPTNAWAVGWYDVYQSGVFVWAKYLVEHWDGHAWTVTDTPHVALPDETNRYVGVSASSDTNAWVIGSEYVQGTQEYPYVIHYGCGK